MVPVLGARVLPAPCHLGRLRYTAYCSENTGVMSLATEQDSSRHGLQLGAGAEGAFDAQSRVRGSRGTRAEAAAGGKGAALRKMKRARAARWCARGGVRACGQFTRPARHAQASPPMPQPPEGGPASARRGPPEPTIPGLDRSLARLAPPQPGQEGWRSAVTNDSKARPQSRHSYSKSGMSPFYRSTPLAVIQGCSSTDRRPAFTIGSPLANAMASSSDDAR